MAEGLIESALRINFDFEKEIDMPDFLAYYAQDMEWTTLCCFDSYKPPKVIAPLKLLSGKIVLDTENNTRVMKTKLSQEEVDCFQTLVEHTKEARAWHEKFPTIPYDYYHEVLQ